MSTPRVTFVSNALSLGGTEKGLASFASRLGAGDEWDVHVVGVSELGPRADQLAGLGLPVACADGSEDRLTELLDGADVVHVFRHGAAEPIVPAAVRRAGVKHLVETNIFAHVDRSADRERFDCHLFLSTESLLAYRRRASLEPTPAFHERHRVLSAPIEHEELRRDSPGRDEAARSLGLDPSKPIVGRVGRAADLKWRNIVVDMLPELLRLVPDAQCLLVGATPAKVARLRRLGVLDRCVLRDPVMDPVALASFYAACDVFASAAEIGESQGLGLGEALALEVPVVTCSTPWADNAQVEFVEHGRSGWLASHPRSFAEAVADLLRDDAKRRAFGAAGRERIERDLSADALSEQLARLYRGLLDGDAGGVAWNPSPGGVETFAAEYPARAAAEFRPLSRREQVEVLIERGRERGVRVAAALRSRGVDALRDRVAGVTRRLGS